MGRWATRTAWLDPTVGSSRSRRSEPPPPRFKRSPPLYLAFWPLLPPLLITAHRISLLLRSQNPASAAAPAPHPSPGAVSPFPARGGGGTAPLFLAILDRWLPTCRSCALLYGWMVAVLDRFPLAGRERERERERENCDS